MALFEVCFFHTHVFFKMFEHAVSFLEREGVLPPSSKHESTSSAGPTGLLNCTVGSELMYINVVDVRTPVLHVVAWIR